MGKNDEGLLMADAALNSQTGFTSGKPVDIAFLQSAFLTHRF
ncbi:hypothetical protein [Marinobacter nanhaiticus]|nr:hypothetical protein [Marinobacter nanhaiticus]